MTDKVRRLFDGAGPEIIRWIVMGIFLAGGIFFSTKLKYDNLCKDVSDLQACEKKNESDHTDFKIAFSRIDQKLDDIKELVKK